MQATHQVPTAVRCIGKARLCKASAAAALAACTPCMHACMQSVPLSCSADLLAAQHDAQHVGLHDADEVICTALRKGLVAVGVAARVVDPAGVAQRRWLS